MERENIETSLECFSDAAQSHWFYILRGSGAEIELNKSASARTGRAVIYSYRLLKNLFEHVGRAARNLPPASPFQLPATCFSTSSQSKVIGSRLSLRQICGAPQSTAANGYLTVAQKG